MKSNLTLEEMPRKSSGSQRKVHTYFTGLHWVRLQDLTGVGLYTWGNLKKMFTVNC